MEVLSAFEPDLLLLDVQMPRITGYDVCRAVRAAARWRTLPILFLTATDAVPARVAAFRAGANDFLAKPCVQEELLARVRTHLSHARLLRERADVDSLSGLYLRAPFIAHAEARLSEARRNVGTMCVALLDLDHFKIVNDTRGHAVGDRVIRLFGRLLRERFRSEDLRGRWGGEEFVLAFPGQSAAAVGSIIRRCLAELAREPILDDNGDTFHQTFSAGVACFPHDGEGLHALLQRADRRLYLAKEQGRARVVIDDRQSS
jgi:diguanylate cyclase (GGDEF)-like protein